MALGLICALGAAGAVADGSGRASAARGPAPAPCGGRKGSPTPPRRYRFRIVGTTTNPSIWLRGSKETYRYRGVLKRVICRGPKVEYWQTGGTATQTFKDIPVEPDKCELTGYRPSYAIGNAPTQTRPLRRFEVDVGFNWLGSKYETSVINPERGNPVARGTARCPGPPAGNGATVPITFQHVSTGPFTRKGLPRRVVTGAIVNARAFPSTFRFSIRWRLTAIR